MAEKDKSAHAQHSAPEELFRSMMNMTMGLTSEMTSSAFRMLTNNNGISLLLGRPLLSNDQQQLLKETGAYVRELRELSGLTISDLSTALSLKDTTLIEAVEAGTATLSFELILRIAAIVARHDPVPVVMRLARIYSPGMWDIFSAWGFGRLSLQAERERDFVNILRGHDEARKLSDAEFAEVVKFTQAAFEMALNYVLLREQEQA